MPPILLVNLLLAFGFCTTLSAQDPKAGALGEKLYVDHKCAVCHSVAGKGNQKGPLDGVGARLTEEEIRQWLINPRVMTEKTKAQRKPIMPAYTKMSKDELDAMVVYLKSLTEKGRGRPVTARAEIGSEIL